MLIRVYVDDSTTPIAELAGSSGRAEARHDVDPRRRSPAALRDRRRRPRHRPARDSLHRAQRAGHRGRRPFRRATRCAARSASRSTRPRRGSTPISTCIRSSSIAACRSGPACSRSLIIALGALYLAVDPLAFRAYKAEELAIRGDNAHARAPCAGSARRPDPMQVNLAEGAFLPVLAFDPGKADTARGAATYAAKCAGCHGARGEGRTAQSATLGEQGVFPRLAGQPAAYLYRQLWSFANGWRDERRHAAARRRPHRGRLDRHRRASRASPRDRAIRRRPPSPATSSTSAAPSPPPAGPTAGSPRAGAAMGRTASASRPIFPR